MNTSYLYAVRGYLIEAWFSASTSAAEDEIIKAIYEDGLRPFVAIANGRIDRFNLNTATIYRELIR